MTEFKVGQEIVVEMYSYGGILYEIRKVTKCNKRFVHLDNDQVYSLTTRRKKGADKKQWRHWELSNKTPDEVKPIISKRSLIASIKEVVGNGGLNKLSVDELEQVEELLNG